MRRDDPAGAEAEGTPIVPRYVLAEIDRLRFEQRARWSALSEDARPGHIRLFNKNAGTTWHVPATPCPDRYGWMLTCDDVPSYWRGVLHEEEKERP